MLCNSGLVELSASTGRAPQGESSKNSFSTPGNLETLKHPTCTPDSKLSNYLPCWDQIGSQIWVISRWTRPPGDQQPPPPPGPGSCVKITLATALVPALLMASQRPNPAGPSVMIALGWQGHRASTGTNAALGACWGRGRSRQGRDSVLTAQPVLVNKARRPRLPWGSRAGPWMVLTAKGIEVAEGVGQQAALRQQQTILSGCWELLNMLRAEKGM